MFFYLYKERKLKNGKESLCRNRSRGKRFGSDVELTKHPVEKGIPFTDTVKRNPTTFALSGMIVDTEKMSASETETRLHNLKNTGTVIRYKGRETAGNYQIKSFVTTKDSANGRLGVYPNKFSTSSVSTVQPYPEFEVSADGSNYKVKAYHGSSKFKNIQYTVRLWGI